MRRLVVATVVAALALTLTGCGGGGGEPKEEAAEAPAAAPAAPPVSAENPEPIADRSAETTESFIPMSSLSTMPAEVANGLANKQAMLLFFFNSDQKVTDDTRKEVEAVAEDNTGLIELLTYNLGKSTAIDDEGTISVDSTVLKEDPSVAEAIQFARELKVPGTRFVVVVDDQGYRIFSAHGFIDSELLERQVERAAR